MLVVKTLFRIFDVVEVDEDFRAIYIMQVEFGFRVAS